MAFWRSPRIRRVALVDAALSFPPATGAYCPAGLGLLPAAESSLHLVVGLGVLVDIATGDLSFYEPRRPGFEAGISPVGHSFAEVPEGAFGDAAGYFCYEGVCNCWL